MNRLGEILKEAREKKSLTVQEVSHITKIQQRIIEAIETNDECELPSRPFVRGFIKSYAKVLDLDPDDLLRIYDGPSGQKIIQIPQMAPTPDPILEESNHPKIFSFQNIFRFAVVMILMGSVTAIFVFITNYQHEREIDLAEIERLKLKSPLKESVVEVNEAPQSPLPIEAITDLPVASVLPETNLTVITNSNTNRSTNAAANTDNLSSQVDITSPVSSSVRTEAATSVAEFNSTESVKPIDQESLEKKNERDDREIASIPAELREEKKVKIEDQSQTVTEVTQPVRDSAEKARIVIRALSDTKVEFEPARLGLQTQQLQAGQVFILNTRSGLSIRSSQPKSLEVSVNGRLARPKEQNPSVIDIEL